jgi:hypothetical protein
MTPAKPSASSSGWATTMSALDLSASLTSSETPS